MLKTRFTKPFVTPDIIDRPRIIDILESNSFKPVILVCAPAGYGKSIMVSQWLEKRSRKYAWLALDKNLNNKTIFLEYFIEAIEQIPTLKLVESRKMIGSSQLLTSQALSEQLINELNDLPDHIVLVLDDYHIITNSEIHEFINYLIRFQPKKIQLVISTRFVPPLKVQKLQLYDNLLEISVPDLALDLAEFKALLAKSKVIYQKVNDDIAGLLNWTEGWILGIKMLLRTNLLTESKLLPGRTFSLSQDIEFVVEQLTEVLPQDFLAPLFIASLCDRFNVELLDALFMFEKGTNVKAVDFLEKLKENNLFVIAEDNENNWYRFHHLFMELLRKVLYKKNQSKVAEIQLFISKWFSDRGYIDEGIQYAVNAKDYGLACELISKQRLDLLDKDQWWVLQSWLEKIPGHIRKSNLDLLIAQLWIQSYTWEIKDSAHYLSIVEDLIDVNTNKQIKSEYYFILGHRALFLNSKPEDSLVVLEKSKELWKGSNMLNGGREFCLAVARQMVGKKEMALHESDVVKSGLDQYEFMYLRSLLSKSFVLLLSGDFIHGQEIINQFTFLTPHCNFSYIKSFSYYLKANVNFQLFEETEASLAFEEVFTFKGSINLRAYFDAFAGIVILKAIQNEFNSAWSYMEQMKKEIQQFKDKRFSKIVTSTEMRLSLLEGKTKVPLNWVEMEALSVPKAIDPFCVMEVAELTKIRVLVTSAKKEQVLKGLDYAESILLLLESNNQNYHLIDILLLKTIGYFNLGDESKARRYLTDSRDLSCKQNIKRPFHEARRLAPALFEAIEKDDLVSYDRNIPDNYSNILLTIRELEIARLVADGFRNKEIADQLNISTLTVKSHLTNIYNKLEVSNRTSMLRKARDLQILN